jgi:Zn-dependent protease with chaperone function
MSAPIAVKWFDGQRAQLLESQMIVSRDSVEIISSDGNVLHRVARSNVRISDRIGNTAIRITFDDGGLALTEDVQAISHAFGAGEESSFVSKADRQPAFVVFALLATLGLLFSGYRYLIPVISDAIAMRIPRAAEQSIGKIALEGADRMFLKGSLLSTAQKYPTETVFAQLAKVANLEGSVNLQFRDFPPNALAIPGGTIVMTDGMVKLLNNESRLLAAVIAHELGHIHHRHSLRRILEGSASALIVSAVAGDASGMTAVATSAPLIMSTLKYTRDGELQADRYAHDLLTKAGYSPKDFADAMRRLEAMELCYAIRSKDRRRTNIFSGLFGDEEEEKISVEETSTDSEATKAKRNKARKKRNERKICESGLDKFLEENAPEIEVIKKIERKPTGYLSSHPATHERIDDALRAATPKP